MVHFFANSVLSCRFPFEMSHKSLIFVGHCLLVAKLLSYLISFSEGIRLSLDRVSLWGEKILEIWLKITHGICHLGLPSIFTWIFIHFVHRVQADRSAQWAWKTFDWVRHSWVRYGLLPRCGQADPLSAWSEGEADATPECGTLGFRMHTTLLHKLSVEWKKKE